MRNTYYLPEVIAKKTLTTMSKTRGNMRPRPNPSNKLLMRPAIAYVLKMSKRIITVSSPNTSANDMVNNWLKKLIRSNASSVKLMVVVVTEKKSILISC